MNCSLKNNLREELFKFFCRFTVTNFQAFRLRICMKSCAAIAGPAAGMITGRLLEWFPARIHYSNHKTSMKLQRSVWNQCLVAETDFFFTGSRATQAKHGVITWDKEENSPKSWAHYRQLKDDCSCSWLCCVVFCLQVHDRGDGTYQCEFFYNFQPDKILVEVSFFCSWLFALRYNVARALPCWSQFYHFRSCLSYFFALEAAEDKIHGTLHCDSVVRCYVWERRG